MRFLIIKKAEASSWDWLGENNQCEPRRNLAADYPQWDWFPDWVWDSWRLKWAEEPVKAAAPQAPVRRPTVVAVSGFHPAAFAACGKTRG